MPREVLCSLLEELLKYSYGSTLGRFRVSQCCFMRESCPTQDAEIQSSSTVCVINLTPYDGCLERACMNWKADGGPRSVTTGFVLNY